MLLYVPPAVTLINAAQCPQGIFVYKILGRACNYFPPTALSGWLSELRHAVFYMVRNVL